MNGWRLVGLLSLVMMAMSLWLLAGHAGDVEGIRLVIRATARTSLVLFVMAFTAGALVELVPSDATRWQRRNRRYLGVSFAVSHFIHLAAIVGLAFQDPDRQIFAGKVRTEVSFGPRNLGRRGADVDAAVRAALVATGLDKDADANPYDLGYSRRKLLALASILAMDTPVVILDEPTTGQDARGIERVHRVVSDLSAAGRTVVAVSHDMRFVADAFERVVVMRDGRIVLDGPPGDVFAEAAWPTLESTFLEPPLAARIGARLGLGSTPTDETLLAALRDGGARRPTATAGG